MKRDYTDGNHDDVIYFTGTEIEKTPAYGKKTLFVVGLQPPVEIIDIAKSKNCEHVYLGANHSFQPGEDHKVWDKWELMARLVTEAGLLVTVDHDLKYSQWFLETGFVENNMVIPMVSIKIPYVEQYGYNACFKIDDKDFKATNSGVWVHSMQDLTARDKFTHWSEYTKDLPL